MFCHRVPRGQEFRPPEAALLALLAKRFVDNSVRRFTADVATASFQVIEEMGQRFEGQLKTAKAQLLKRSHRLEEMIKAHRIHELGREGHRCDNVDPGLINPSHY